MSLSRKQSISFIRNFFQSRIFSLILVLTAFFSVIATYLTMTGISSFHPHPTFILFLMNFDLILVLILAFIVTKKLVLIWIEHRKGVAGAKLHIHLVLLFSCVAVTPAIVVAVLAALFLHFGIQGWFNNRIRTAVEESMLIAQAYLKEHQELIRADVLATTNDLQRFGINTTTDLDKISNILTDQALSRGLPEIFIINQSLQVIAKSKYNFFYGSAINRIAPESFDQARTRDVVLLVSSDSNTIRAIAKIPKFIDAFLLIGRFIDPNVIDRINKARKAVNTYNNLEDERSGIVITFIMIFILIAVVLLLSAVSLGLMVATRLVEPISQLIHAAQHIRDGDFTFRVPIDSQGHEIEALSRAFNKMTTQLDTQRNEIFAINRLNNERMRLTEAILRGVTAGVIGVGPDYTIHLPNRSASNLLGINLEDYIGQNLIQIVSEFSPLFDNNFGDLDRRKPRHIEIHRKGINLILLTRLTAEWLDDGTIFGYVVTFDDITELQNAQRMAAWTDIARRIAHEIKNPLTPIQLSAERLKRRYLNQIAHDKDIFQTCTDTIIRQVSDIRRMADEFSSFARMPSPKMCLENLEYLIQNAVFLQNQEHQKIIYDFNPNLYDTAQISCDKQQINQCLTNILKNAAESIYGRNENKKELSCGYIKISIIQSTKNHRILVSISDNGKGFPNENHEYFVKPYVTKRSKGTGLGLAIVKKIMEDHGGRLILSNGIQSGAIITLAFPKIR